MGVGAVATRYAVRRLTPRECERLQEFEDDYSLISYRGKPPLMVPVTRRWVTPRPCRSCDGSACGSNGSAMCVQVHGIKWAMGSLPPPQRIRTLKNS